MTQQTSATLGLLLLLGSVLLLGMCGVAWVVALARGARRGARWIAGLGAAYIVGYVLLLASTSVASREVTLPVGQEKRFCAIDCHIGYSIMGQRAADSVGDDVKRAKSARGRFAIVAVKVRFDEKSISERRGYSPLTPDPKNFVLVDDRGRHYDESRDAREALAHTPAGATNWLQPLRPGEWFTKELVFDVPADARGLRLLIEETDPVYRLYIGHENSLLHRKTLLSVGV